MTLPSSFSDDTILVSLTKASGTEHQIAPIVETIDIDEGDKDIEVFVSVGGGRIVKKVPQDVTTVTFEGYPVGIAAANGLSQLYHGDISDSSQPLAVSTGISRFLFRVAILFTEDTTATTACGATTASKWAYRWYAEDAYFVSFKKSFTDRVWKGRFVFKCPPFTKAAASLITEEEADGSSGGLPALTTYT